MNIAEIIHTAYETRSKVTIALDDGTVYNNVRIVDYNSNDILVDKSEGNIELANGAEREYECLIEHIEIDAAELSDDREL